MAQTAKLAKIQRFSQRIKNYNLMTSDSQIKGNELFLRQKQYTKFNGPTIICDGLRTPENLGSILRIADATGSQGVILLDSNIDLNNAKIAKLSRSTNQKIIIEKLTLKELTKTRARFKKIIALEITQQSENLFDSDILSCDAVVLGHESTGIRNETLALCDMTIHLPMFGINGSMNISHALAIFLYEWRRQEKTA